MSDWREEQAARDVSKSITMEVGEQSAMTSLTILTPALCAIVLDSGMYWRFQRTIKHVSNRNHSQEASNTRMWADTQRDGRPAEYRWRPLLNAAQTVEWMKMPLCTEIGLGRGDTVLDRELPPHGKGHSSPQLFSPCLLRPNVRPSQQLMSSCSTLVE